MPDALKATMNLLDAQQSVLLIVDMQTRLLAAMQPDDAAALLDNTLKLLTAARLLHVPVLLSEQYPRGLGLTADVIQTVLSANTIRFEKTVFSCCGNPAFHQALLAGGRRQVIIAGLEAHVCVLQTAFELLQQGYQVYVVEDAVCSRLNRHKANALLRMQQAGVVNICHESVLFEWLRDAGHADFKTLSALVK